MFFNFIYRIYKDKFYDKLIQEFIGEIPDVVREPVLDFLADRKVLFEKFLSIQAYHIQRARINSKKNTEFYDGALLIIRAFLAAVNKKIQQRTTMNVGVDKQKESQEELQKVSKFLEESKK